MLQTPQRSDLEKAGKNDKTIGKDGFFITTDPRLKAFLERCTMKVEFDVGIFSTLASLGAPVFCRKSGSIDKGTCIVYSRGPGRLTTMRGNKASCYFFTKVQTCIDRNLAPQIKTGLQAADVKPSWALCVCVHICVSGSVPLGFNFS